MRTIIFHFGVLRDACLMASSLAAHRDLPGLTDMALARQRLSFFFQEGKIEEGQRFLDSLPSQTKFACLVGPGFLSQLSKQSEAGFRARFPGIRMKAFVSFPRQDKALESVFVWNSLYGRSVGFFSAWLRWQFSAPIYDYANGLSHLWRIFGKENAGVFVGGGGGPEEEQRAQDAFWKFAGINAPENAQGLRSVPPALNLAPGRDLCEFARLCAMVNKLGPSPWENPWFKATLRFSPQAPHLQSSEQRRDFLARWAASNAKLAAMLGKNKLFSDPDPEPDWKPYPGLTPKTARSIVEQLDRGFAEELLYAFDRTPKYHLIRAQRVAYQALRDIVGKGAESAVSVAGSPPPKLSVLTLTCNHAAYIRENLKSVIAQRVNFPIWHIIADDGSDDGTQDIILDYAAKHPHIVPLLRQSRAHPWSNVHALFDMARSPYVALCDGDDYFTDPGKLQIQADFLDANPSCALCFHPVQVLYEDGSKPPRVYPPPEALPRGVRPFYYLADLLRFNMIQTNSVMYRWRFAKGLPGWFRPDLLPGDWYWHLLHAETGKIGFLNKIMSVYRRHKKSVYYSAELDILLHRAKMGMHELELYAAVNQHFSGKYASLLGNMANGVFSHVLLHARDTGDNSLFEAMVKKYPDFAARYLESLKKTQTQSDGTALSPEDTA